MPSPLLIFGDSVGKGVIFDSLQNKYRFLKDNFARLFSQSSGMQVENFSAFGCTVTKGMKIVERQLAAADAPGLGETALLEFGGNDCDYDWKEISEHPDSEHFPKTPIDEFIRVYIRMIDTLRKAGKTPVLLSLPPIDPTKYFAWVSRGLSAENILRWLGDKGRIYRWQEYYNLAVLKIAGMTSSPIIDLRSSFLVRKDCFDLLCEDGIHPNERGHALISEIVSQWGLCLAEQK